ncbi:MAG: hypothetical protein H7318_12320 [Oligoflexus sp.]|nr:hypothetical protein [Oligoflexus sp.]
MIQRFTYCLFITFILSACGLQAPTPSDSKGNAVARRIVGLPIRQIEAKALRKLRHPSRSKKLRAFIEQ